ncbi:MAG: hypothetical protein Q7T33_13730 [Dehalococcoidia bacterium]|nr:hypothetical protein [Dehalococcoidia bacterium]
MHRLTADEVRHWLGVEPGEELDALIFMGLLDYPQALDAWSSALKDVRKALWPNAIVGMFGEKRLAVAAGYGAAVAGDITHLCCLLGARAVLVTGYFGGLQRDIGYGDVLLPTRAHPLDSVSAHYLGDERWTDASQEVVEWLAARCEEEGLPYHLGPLVSAASIMTETPEHFAEWHEAGYYGVDLEVAVVFSVARRFGARRGALLVQSDSPIDGVYVSAHRTAEERDLQRRRQYQIGAVALQAALKFAGAGQPMSTGHTPGED